MVYNEDENDQNRALVLSDVDIIEHLWQDLEQCVKTALSNTVITAPNMFWENGVHS